MQTFKDSAGDEWSIALPYGLVMEVTQKSNGRFDLLEPFNQDENTLDLQQRLREKPAEFWELLQLLTEDQADARGIDAKQFGRLMASDSIVDAQIAFFAEWVDFFHRGQRPDVATALAKIQAVQVKAIELLRNKIETSEEIKTLEQRAIEKLNRDLSTASDTLREKLASVLSPSPGASSGGSTKSKRASKEPATSP